MTSSPSASDSLIEECPIAPARGETATMNAVVYHGPGDKRLERRGAVLLMG